MKKILIVNTNLGYGGIGTSMVNLVNSLKHDYVIDLLIFYDQGPLKHRLDQTIRIIKPHMFVQTLGMSLKVCLKYGNLFQIVYKILSVIWSRIFSNSLPIKFALKFQEKLGDYDIAIAYRQEKNNKSTNDGVNNFVLKCVNANQKISWIHADVIKANLVNDKNRKLYRLFDKIITVSEGTRKSFLNAYPELSSKTLVIKNLLNYEEIYKKASIDSSISLNFNKNYLNIITVCRLSKEKGILRAIKVIEKLLYEKYNIKYHIVGDGPERKVILNYIKNKQLSRKIIFYGNQENPYIFIKNADIFLLPSYHEAAPMVVNEAKVLGIPVLMTDTISAYEMVGKDNSGWVCENSIEGIYNMLVKILNNKEEIIKKKAVLNTLKFSNKDSLEKLKSIFNN